MNFQPRTARWLALLWTLGIIVACLMPSSRLPTSTSISLADKLAHALMFAGFGGLWMHAASGPWPGRMARVGAAGALFAAATEAAQYLLPLRRSPEWLDVVADLVGLTLALACYAGYRHFLRRPQNAERA